MDRQAELASAKALVARGERLVARQCEVLANLAANGRDTTLAGELLEKLEISLAGLRGHLEVVRREVAADASSRTPHG